MATGIFQVRIGTTEEYANASISGGTEGVNYVEFPIASTYKTTSSTVVDSSRNSKAIVIASVIRAGIRKIELTWRVISITNYALISSFLNEADNFMFYAYYFDQDTNSWLTKKFYVGDRVADALKNEQWKTTNRGGKVEPNHIENFKLSLIEV